MEIMDIEGVQITFAHTGRVLATLVNPVMDETLRKRLRPHAVMADRITAIVGEGISGDRHVSPRSSDIRELKTCGVPRKTAVLNYREFSAVSSEELWKIKHELKLPVAIPRGALGENLIFKGIPWLSDLPPTSLLHFWDSAGVKRSTVLAVWSTNNPCAYPGKLMQQHWFPEIEDLPERFADLGKLATKLRGIVGLVFCGGIIAKGDTVRVQLFEPK